MNASNNDSWVAEPRQARLQRDHDVAGPRHGLEDILVVHGHAVAALSPAVREGEQGILRRGVGGVAGWPFQGATRNTGTSISPDLLSNFSDFLGDFDPGELDSRSLGQT